MKWTLDGVPDRPGCYLFRTTAGRVLYVGKARDLRARLRSYARPEGDGRWQIPFLMEDADSVETIVTRTEQEALLLEDSLIKQHKPPHNVRLKDDKSFLMVRVDLGEKFPRLKLVRAHQPKAGKTGGRSRLFGPFATASAVRGTLSDLHRVVPLRDCPDSVMNHRSRACLKHQIGLCSAPCVDKISAEGYAGLVTRAIRVLSGETEELESDLELRMQKASEALEYERAGVWRDRLAALRRTVEGQGVRPPDSVVRDVLHFARRGDMAVVHRLSFRDGRMAESRSHHFRSQLPDEELMHVVLTALYSSGRRVVPEELVLPCIPAERELLQEVLGPRAPKKKLTMLVPTSGPRRKMMDIAGENARVALTQQDREESREESALAELVTLLDLDPSLEVMDCFDVSNFQGSHVVASRVRFRRGHADRSGYRRFKVRTVDGQDDFASMREIVLRSLRRGMQDDDLPDLIVIDGGEPQLKVALEARQEAGAWEVQIIGLAKARAERKVGGKRKEASEERVWIPEAKAAIELARHSPARHLLERIRDEAHRFAITYHRKERGKIKSRLDSIPGVGDARRKALLRKFGSVAGVQRASVEELEGIQGVSPALARTILDHLESKD
ncbi:MAG: excinuclease ABC subunit C [Planctomycetota bacterium]|jgi:excinuclease ABC subunit C